MPAVDTQLPPKCPHCGRLTVDNQQHCPDLKPGRWALTCRTITCLCGAMYRAGAWCPPSTGGRRK